MTVSELIEALKEMHLDSPVFLFDLDGAEAYCISKDDITDDGDLDW